MLKRLKIYIIKIYIYVLKPVKRYNKPKEVDIVIFDRVGSENLISYFKNYDYEILDIRGESINLYVLFKTILKNRFSIFGYIMTYIELSSPKVVITFMDNNFFFYKIKSLYPNTNMIFVQNGMRGGSADIFNLIEDKSKSYTNIEVDYMFVFDKNIGERYKKYIKGEAIAIGSFKCNEFYKDKEILSLNKKAVVFISQYRYCKKSLDLMYKDITYKDFYMAETILLPMIKKYCIDNSLDLIISGCTNGEDNNEYDFYNNILGNDGWSIKYKKNNYTSYETLLEVYGVVYIDSTLGMESITIGKRTCAFSARENFINDTDLSFGWSSGLARKGKFWTDEINEEEFNRITDFVFNSSDMIWQTTIDKIQGDLMEFDKGNQKFITVVDTILNKDQN